MTSSDANLDARRFLLTPLDNSSPPRLALLHAIAMRDMPMLRRLLADSALRSELDAPGAEYLPGPMTPLVWAIRFEWSDGVAELLRAGADPNAGEPSHLPLLMAAFSRDDASARLLLAAGADPSAKDCFGDTYFHVAAARAPELLSELPARSTPWPGIDLPDQDGLTALAVAANHAHLDAMDALARAGADLNAIMADKSTALILAVEGGWTQSLGRLIALGSDMRRRNLGKHSALDRAVQLGFTAAAQALMDAGVDPREAPAGCPPPTYWANNADHMPASIAVLARARSLDEREALAGHASLGRASKGSPCL